MSLSWTVESFCGKQRASFLHSFGGNSLPHATTTPPGPATASPLACPSPSLLNTHHVPAQQCPLPACEIPVIVSLCPGRTQVKLQVHSYAQRGKGGLILCAPSTSTGLCTRQSFKHITRAWTPHNSDKLGPRVTMKYQPAPPQLTGEHTASVQTSARTGHPVPASQKGVHTCLQTGAISHNTLNTERQTQRQRETQRNH